MAGTELALRITMLVLGVGTGAWLVHEDRKHDVGCFGWILGFFAIGLILGGIGGIDAAQQWLGVH